jgi:isochorismate hydrolase
MNSPIEPGVSPRSAQISRSPLAMSLVTSRDQPCALLKASAFAEPTLLAHLQKREADALIVSGSETDVCVLATVLDAVDLGYRVIVLRDAVCSSSDEAMTC